MMNGVEFPAMRDQVISSLMSLSDANHQRTRWGVVEPGVDYYDDLTLNVHVLYDDVTVVPDPSSVVGTVLYPGEVDVFVQLDKALGSLIVELGDRPDGDYLNDPRWPQVLQAAGAALSVMRESDGGEHADAVS